MLVRLKNRNDMGCEVGKNSKTALNLLVGATNSKELLQERKKIDKLITAPLDIISDVSVQSFKDPIWSHIIKNTPFVAATLPIYYVKSNEAISENELFEEIAKHIEFGVGLITIHPTPTISLIESAKARVIPVTSRGGGIIIRDLQKWDSVQKDNVYIRIIDKIALMASKYSVVISIGASFRSATILDSFDMTQQEEMKSQIEIANYLCNRGVSVIIETPGHATIEDIERIGSFFSKYKYPIMPLGPMPTDTAFDEDDTAAAIGAVLMGRMNCADILSIVTRKEHAGSIPTLQDVLDAIKKYKVAAHIIDLNKIHDFSYDSEITRARVAKSSCIYNGDELCTRCGEYCPLRQANR